MTFADVVAFRLRSDGYRDLFHYSFFNPEVSEDEIDQQKSMLDSAANSREGGRLETLKITRAAPFSRFREAIPVCDD